MALAPEGRSLRLELEPSVTVEARRSHLASILTTLLDNAVEHGAGAVTVTVDADGDDVRPRVADEVLESLTNCGNESSSGRSAATRGKVSASPSPVRLPRQKELP